MKFILVVTLTTIAASSGQAMAVSAPPSPILGSSDVHLVHRGPAGGWHCNRETYARPNGWHYHRRECGQWTPNQRTWRGQAWRKGCWVNRAGRLTCSF
jgi:hypothetical protein